MLIERYEILDLLGTGGMGRVYRARHHPSGRELALKTLLPQVGTRVQSQRMLLNEAVAAARLRHPNIVELLDIGRDAAGNPFLAMELVAGCDMARWLERWPGWPAVAHAFDAVLAGLSAAHAARIVHRDLKPGNVLIAHNADSDPPGAPVVKLADFGIARVIDPLGGDTESEGVLGTPAYMAPEQLNARALLGPWTDLYAVGVMLYEALAGELPFAGRSLVAVMSAKVLASVRPLTPRRGLEVPPGLVALVHALLTTDARRRPRFAAQVRARLALEAPLVVDRVGMQGAALAQRTNTAAGPTTGDTVNADDAAIALDPPRSARAWSTPGAVSTTVANAATAVADADPTPATPATPASGALEAIFGTVAIAPSGVHGEALLRLREVPLVGRERECEALRSEVERVCSHGGPRVLLLMGEPGTGKSRIARYGLAEVEREGRMEGLAAGYDLSGAEHAGGLRTALRRLLGVPDRDDAEVPAEWRWFAGDGPHTDFDGRALVRWLRDASPADELEPSAAAALVAGVLLALSRVRPVYLWVDDIGWSRDGALEVIARLLDIPDARVLVVATLRLGTSQYPPLASRLQHLVTSERARVLTLSSLDERERLALVSGIVPLADELSDALRARLGGTALELVHLAYDWAESGVLVRAPGGYALRPGAALDDLLASRSLDALTDQRIDALVASFGERRDAAEKLLYRAANLGVRFDEGALRAAAPSERATGLIDAVLERALLHGILQAEGAGAYVFEHGLVQQRLAARSRASVTRRELLTDAANGLLAYYGSSHIDVASTAATLLRDAGELARAWEQWDRVVRGAARIGNDPMALVEIERGRRWAREDAAQGAPDRGAEVEACESLVHYFALRYDDALACIVRAREAYVARGDATNAALCSARVADIYYFQERFAESEACARELPRLAALDDPAAAHLGAVVYHRLAELALLRDDLRGAREHFERAAHFAVVEGPQATYPPRLSLALIAMAVGDHDAAEATLNAVERDATTARDAAWLEDIAMSRARLLLRRGLAPRARALLHTVAGGLERRDDRWLLTELRLLSALIAAALDPPEAVAMAVAAFLAAFRAVPHDEVHTRADLLTLQARLDALGLHALGDELAALRAAREALLAEKATGSR